MGGRGGSSGLKSSLLPNLEGTEKQIRWAESIRLPYAANFDKFKKDIFANQYSREYYSAEQHMESLVDKSNPVDRKGYSILDLDIPKRYTETQRENFIKDARKKFRDSGKPKSEWKSEKEKAIVSYKKWLIKEYKNVLKNKKSAKWWIESFK